MPYILEPEVTGGVCEGSVLDTPAPPAATVPVGVRDHGLAGGSRLTCCSVCRIGRGL